MKVKKITTQEQSSFAPIKPPNVKNMGHLVYNPGEYRGNPGESGGISLWEQGGYDMMKGKSIIRQQPQQ